MHTATHSWGNDDTLTLHLTAEMWHSHCTSRLRCGTHTLPHSWGVTLTLHLTGEMWHSHCTSQLRCDTHTKTHSWDVTLTVTIWLSNCTSQLRCDTHTAPHSWGPPRCSKVTLTLDLAADMWHSHCTSQLRSSKVFKGLVDFRTCPNWQLNRCHLKCSHHLSVCNTN